MSPRILLLMAALTATAVAGARGEQAATADTARLGEARAAMGGVDRLAGVRTIVLKGRRRFPNGWYSMGGAQTQPFIVERLEVRILLPDHYQRTLVNVGTGVERVSGFAGPALLGDNARPTPAGVAPPPELLTAMREWHREDLGRFLLRVLLKTDSIYPFRLLGTTAGTLTLTEPDGTKVTIEVDPVSHLPRRLHYSKRAQATAPAMAGKRFDDVTEISDYRPVGALRLPHKLVESQDGKFAMETLFDSIEINVPLTAASFTR